MLIEKIMNEILPKLYNAKDSDMSTICEFMNEALVVSHLYFYTMLSQL